MKNYPHLYNPIPKKQSTKITKSSIKNMNTTISNHFLNSKPSTKTINISNHNNHNKS